MEGLKKLASFGLVATMLATLAMTLPVEVALAASLQNQSDTLSSSKVSTLSNHTIIFRTPTGVEAPTDTITITFPSEFGMGSFDFHNFAIQASAGSQSNCTSLSYTDKTVAASPAAGVWGVGQSGQVVTFTAPTDATTGEVATNACVRVMIGDNSGHGGVKQITNPADPNNYTILFGGTFGDTGNVSVAILTDDGVDVTSTVAQSLTFSISDSTIGFGTLSASAARYATGNSSGSSSQTEAHNIIVATNAANGYTMTVNGTTLTAGSYTIAPIGGTNTASTTGTEQFGLRMTATGGSGAVSAPYAASGYAFDSAGFPSAPSETASSASPSAATTYSVRYIANISDITEAADYSAAVTYAATANF